MKYALVLESCTKNCNETSMLLASLGYLITPVFKPTKALHAAHMIQFDLILTCTEDLPGDRRSLIGELSRCSPDAVLILVADQEPDELDASPEGVSAVLYRPLTVDQLKAAIERGSGNSGMSMPPPGSANERRRKAVD